MEVGMGRMPPGHSALPSPGRGRRGAKPAGRVGNWAAGPEAEVPGAGLPVGDVAMLVGVEEVVGSDDLPDGRLELLDVAGAVEGEEGPGAPDLALPVGALLGEGNPGGAAHHRAVGGTLDPNVLGAGVLDVDRLHPNLEGGADAVEH